MITCLKTYTQRNDEFQAKVLYQSDHLVISQISENSFLHISYLQTYDFGKVPCNGLIIRNGKEALVLDTPVNDADAEALIQWVQETLGCQINAVIPTHFHEDCLGGLPAFEKNGIPSYANFKTIELARDQHTAVPANGFENSMTFMIGDQRVVVKFYGEGHSKDNVIGYFSGDNLIFGGCLIKEIGAGKGYLGDANVREWSNTVNLIKKAYPNVKIIVPGHGAYGDSQLLDYTMELFSNQ
nr:subclass B1 metallo-beta-lactamase [Robertkochia solimangrovi]